MGQNENRDGNGNDSTEMETIIIPHTSNLQYRPITQSGSRTSVIWVNCEPQSIATGKLLTSTKFVSFRQNHEFAYFHHKNENRHRSVYP